VPQAPQMGVLRHDHLMCCLPTVDGLGGISNLEQIKKLNYFSNVFFFPCTFMSLHASYESCENLILFEFLVFSQVVSLGSIALDIHVAKSSFSSFDFLDEFGVDGLSRFSRRVDHNHSLELSRQVFFYNVFQMVFQNFE
jgi:hypothetical protein